MLAGTMGTKAYRLLLALALGIAMLAPTATATAQSSASTFDEAEGPDDTCDLQLLAGGPYEVSIDGSPAVIYENDSVIAVPQGSSIRYIRVERTIGSTAIGTNETCAEFVPSAEPTPATDGDGDGISVPFIAGVGAGVVVAGAAAWWLLIGSKRS